MKKKGIFIPFGGADVHVEDIRAASGIVLPVSYEVAPSYGAGSADGAYHMLRASWELERIDEETLKDWSSAGIHTLEFLEPSKDPETAMKEIRDAAIPLFSSGKFVLSIGGDHAVSIGLIEAAAASFPDMGVCQVDAHLDLRDSWNGSRYNHACVMRRVADDLGLPFVQVGIRAVSREEARYLVSKGIKPFFAHLLDAGGEWIEKVLDLLPGKVYLTFDLDGLDPSILPGTGTPEPGGLTYAQAVMLVRKVGECKKVVGADITELAKIPGTQVSEFTAAKIASKMLLHFT